jgi:hypothetical protein
VKDQLVLRADLCVGVERLAAPIFTSVPDGGEMEFSGNCRLYIQISCISTILIKNKNSRIFVYHYFERFPEHLKIIFYR